MNLTSLLGAAALSVLSGAAFEPQPNFTVDQRHDLLNTATTAHNIRLAGFLIQEFVPQASRLNVIELWTEDFGTPRTNGLGASLQVLLRKDTVGGELLASSAIVRLEDNFNGITRFEFAESVPLVPGERYAIDIQLVSGDDWGVRSYGEEWPQYQEGRYFRGQKLSDSDMWFRTGFQRSGPVLRWAGSKAIEWETEPGQTYRVWGSHNLRDWQDLATIQADERVIQYAIESAAQKHYFYAVSE